MPEITIGGAAVLGIILFVLVKQSASPKTIAVFAVMFGVAIAGSMLGDIAKQGGDVTVEVTDAGIKAGEGLVAPAEGGR